jgi:hypothetical protein
LNLEAFCYLGLLKFPEQLDAAMPLLADAQRTECSELLASIRQLPKAELLRRWSGLRYKESSDMRGTLHERCGIQFEDLPPAVAEWWAAWLERQNG